jgi:hypothetical protein
MSKEIRDLINSIKSNQAESTPVSAEPKPIVVKNTPPSVVKEKTTVKASDKPPAEKKEKPEPKPKAEPAQAKQARAVLDEAFFNTLNENEFSFEQKSVSNIDDRIYEIFMLIKRKKRIKNIAVIVNTVLNNFIEDNKDEIKNLLAGTPL